ncbi:putative protein S-acyltransferase 5 [Abeliophyllum distichum]|uniref:Uncharacterized protein n=1 Tax=Abeliophyllum distichum TaxID=126358 RepID=A0ABD1RUS8_9LAMI
MLFSKCILIQELMLGSAFCLLLDKQDGYSLYVVTALLQDLVLLLPTSGRDPGIIPRNDCPPELESYGGLLGVHTVQFAIIVSNGLTIIVRGLDSVLDWFCWFYIKRTMDIEKTSVWKATTKTSASIALIVYTFLSLWFRWWPIRFSIFTSSLQTSQHTRSLYQYDRLTNPYGKGVVQNFIEIFCTSIPPSKHKFLAKIHKDSGIPPQSVGGSFGGPNSGMAKDNVETGRKPVWDESMTG